MASPTSTSTAVTPRAMLDSPEFKAMVARRWRVSLVYTAILFVLYYGYILLIALDKTLMAKRIGEVTTLGIPVGVAVILLSWVLTAAYVYWSNTVHDVEAHRLRAQLDR